MRREPGPITNVLSLTRAAVGVTVWTDPVRGARAFGLGDVAVDPSAAFIGRLFGARDLALGVTARHPDPALRRAAITVGMAVDSADVVAGLLALCKGAPKLGVLIGAGGAATLVALGALALRELDGAAEEATEAA